MNWRKAVLVAFFAYVGISGALRDWQAGERDIFTFIGIESTLAFFAYLVVTA